MVVALGCSATATARSVTVLLELPDTLRHDFHMDGRMLNVGADHWLAGVERCPSSNCDDRTDPADISLIVVHGISLPPGRFGGDAVKQFFTNCLDCAAHPSFGDLVGVRVSAHLFVERTG